MSATNYHLNLFRHYAANTTDEVLENNLTRALALCLMHDPVFLYAFLEEILTRDALHQELHLLNDDASRIVIDVQRPVNQLAACETLYAVALTAGPLDATDYEAASAHTTDAPITDLTIRLNDVLILVEVKRTGEDCLGQLKQQVGVYRREVAAKEGTTDVAPTVRTLSWARTTRLATDLHHFRQLAGAPQPFTADLVELIRSNYPTWDEALYLRAIQFRTPEGKIKWEDINRRLHDIQYRTFGDRMKWFHDRVSMPIDQPWASEVISQPDWDEAEQRAYIALQVWPGNTKGQGWPIYSRSLDWTTRDSLEIDGKRYPLVVIQQFKFSHFNKFIGEYDMDELPVQYVPNFRSWAAYEKYSGQKWRDSWPQLEAMLDADTGGHWRQVYQMWQDKFINSNRNYCNLSLGFYVKVRLPYEELRALDSGPEQWVAVGSKFKAAIQALVDLVEGR